MKRSNAISRSTASPWKRSISVTGRRPCSTGGENEARALRQNAVAVNAFRHHSNQRSTVRRSTRMLSFSRSNRPSVLHHRYQHDDRGEIDLAGEKAQRRRRRPAAAAVPRAAEAEAPVMVRADTASSTARLAPIPCRMQHATALSASRTACIFGKLAIELEQEIVESGIGQKRLVQNSTSSARR
jgi:hypothetical protein